MKDTFILHMRYKDIFSQLSCAQAGMLIKAIFEYQASGKIESWQDPSLTMSFLFIRQDLDYNTQKYKAICAQRAQSGRKGGLSKTSKRLPTDKTAPQSTSKHNDKNNDKNNDKDNINTSTAQAQPVQDAHTEQEKKKTRLQQFANEVLANYEAYVQTDAQKDIWFKRNCRCLRDIWEFCGQDTTLALRTIRVCILRLKKAGLTGGYEAVCRNLPEYYAQAKEELEAEYGYTK